MAAARELQRRISSILFRNQSHTAAPHFNPSWRRLSDFFSTERRRSIQTLSELNKNKVDEPESIQKQLDQTTIQGLVVDDDDDASKTSSVNYNYTAVSSLKTSARHDFAMVFTCKVCETRSVKTASRESFDKGVVVARCDGCNNLHLIADRLGWFGEPGSVEEFLAARGEEVKKGSVDTLNLTLEDLAGLKKLS